MIDFSRWKLGLLGLVLLAGVLYALPNLFPQDLAVQVSANRGAVLDEAVRERVEGALQEAKVASKGISLEQARLLVRLDDSDAQLKPAEVLRGELGDAYTVALNLASLTYMVPLGVSASAAVLVGQAVGRDDPLAARRSARTALTVGAGFMLTPSA